MDDRHSAIKAHARSAQAAARRQRERDAGRGVQDDELESERPQRLWDKREETEAERDDVAQEDRPRHRTELRVARIGEGADVDGQCDEQKSEKARGRRDERDVEVMPQDELFRHHAISINHSWSGVRAR